MVSIIVPVYNCEQTLVRCINSIVTQVCLDYELLLVDDGSTDNSANLCDKYAKKYPQIKVCHKNNGGVSSARNLGLKYSSGEWVMFVDADDYISDDFIPSYLNENIDLYVLNWRCIENNESDGLLGNCLYTGTQLKEFLSSHLHYSQFRCPWAKVFKKKIIDEHQINFNNAFHIGEDTLFVFEYLLHCNSLMTIEKGYYLYHKGEYNKYSITIDDSLLYLNHLWELYSKLGCKSKSFLKMIYYFYYGITINIENKSVNSRWMSNNAIIHILKELYYERSFWGFLIISKLYIKSFYLKVKSNY